jgi:K+-transporting ATPase ATPase C chain
MKQLRPALVSLGLLTILTGVIYPLAVTAVAQVLFPAQANGSLLTKDGKPVGSALIGQPFDDPKYFWSRLSATSPMAYNGAASSGSNLGPVSDALTDEVRGRIDALKAADPGNTLPIPVDLVTSSGSGARTRGLPEATVRDLVAHHTHGRQWGIFGEPVVDVLPLNLALDAQGARS